MKKCKLILMWTLVLFFCTVVEGASLKLIKTVGNDENDNYIFVRIKGGVLSKKKDIYVLEAKRNSLSRFDWNGKFIKKIGQKGQGPGDFSTPGDLDYFNEKLYVEDGLNSRVIEIDPELENLTYHRIPSGSITMGDFSVIGNGRFAISGFPDYSGDRFEYVRVITLEPLSVKTFFDETPFPINYKDTKSSRSIVFARPKIGTDRKNRRMLITFGYPDEPIRFFVYSFEGECLDTFTYSFDKSYRLPGFILNGTRAKDFTAVMVLSIFVHKDNYVVFMGKIPFKNRWPVDEGKEMYCLIFDTKSKQLKHRIEAPGNLEALSISQDGFLLGTDSFEDVPKLYIYKLEF